MFNLLKIQSKMYSPLVSIMSIFTWCFTLSHKGSDLEHASLFVLYSNNYLHITKITSIFFSPFSLLILSFSLRPLIATWTCSGRWALMISDLDIIFLYFIVILYFSQVFAIFPLILVTSIEVICWSDTSDRATLFKPCKLHWLLYIIIKFFFFFPKFISAFLFHSGDRLNTWFSRCFLAFD